MTPEGIRALREARHLTQAEFGKRLHVSAHAIRAWEAGRRKPSPPLVRALLRLRRLQGRGHEDAPCEAIARLEESEDLPRIADRPGAAVEAGDSHAPVSDGERVALRSRLAAWEEEGRRLLETAEVRRDVIARLLGVTRDTLASLPPPVDPAHQVAPSTSCPECDGTGWHRIPGTVQTCHGRFSLPSWKRCAACNAGGGPPLPSRLRG